MFGLFVNNPGYETCDVLRRTKINFIVLMYSTEQVTSYSAKTEELFLQSSQKIWLRILSLERDICKYA